MTNFVAVVGFFLESFSTLVSFLGSLLACRLSHKSPLALGVVLHMVIVIFTWRQRSLCKRQQDARLAWGNGRNWLWELPTVATLLLFQL